VRRRVKNTTAARRSPFRPLYERLAPRIKALHLLQGISRHEIARYLAISNWTVTRALACDVAPSPKVRLHLHRRRALAVLSLRSAGAGFQKIRRATGVRRPAVLRLLAKEAAGQPAALGSRIIPIADYPEEIRRLIRRGLATEAIARRVGVGRETVAKYRRGEAPLPAKSKPRQRRSAIMSLAEFAAAIGVDDRLIAEAIRAGEIPGVIKLGRQFLIPRQALRIVLQRDLGAIRTSTASD